MSRLCVVKSLGLVVAAALTLSVSPLAQAQDFAGAVKTVAGTKALPVITERIDDSDLGVLSKAISATHEFKGAKDLGAVEGSQVLSLQLNLRRPLEQQKSMDLFRQYTENPDSPLYGKTLTPFEFAKEFGLASSDLTTLTEWLQAQGFKVGNVDNGRMTIGFSGTAAQAEATFHTELHNYMGADGAQHMGNATEVQIPAALQAAVSSVGGLRTFTVSRAANFGAPVTDFATGTTGEKFSLAGGGKVVEAKLDGEMLHDSSFTASRYSMVFGDTLTLNLRLGGENHPVSGSVSLSDNGKVIATISDISKCADYNGGYGRSCTADFTPKQIGRHELVAVYSGDDHNRGTELTIVTNAAGTGASYTTVQQAPIGYTSGNFTFYTVTAWAGIAQLTGTQTGQGSITVTAASVDGTIAIGGAVYPVAPALTSSGSGTDGLGFAFTYTCATNLMDKTVGCSIVNPDAEVDESADFAGEGEVAVTAAYSGDANYAATSGTTIVYVPFYIPTVTPTLANNTVALTAGTYGATQTEPALSWTVTGVTGDYNPGGSGATSNTNEGQFVELTGPYTGQTGAGTVPNQIGSLVAYQSFNSACLATTITCSLTGVGGFTIPAVVTPGTYALNFAYSGNSICRKCYYGVAATTIAYTENKQQPTAAMTTPTAAAPTTQNAGALTAFTVTGTLAWTGVGAEPTPTNVTFTSTAAGTFGAVTCTTGTTAPNIPTTPLTCSALFTPTAGDAAGSYNINLSFATDVNYLAVASTVTGNYIISVAKVTPTLALSPVPISSVYKATTTQAVTATLTGTAANGSTAGSVVTVTASATYGVLSTTAGATTGTASVTCTTVTTTSPASACTVYFIPNGTTNVGLYTGVFSATATAVGNYNAETTPAMDSLNITIAPATLTLTDPTPGTTALGVTSTTLTATLSPAISNISVTFTDSTVSPAQTFTANTNASGVATVTLTTSTLGGFAPGGKNVITATTVSNGNISAATSNALTLYLQGILFSTTGKHDFSGLITYQGRTVEGTVDGTSVGPYGVTIYNFTSAAQTLTLTPPSSNAAFSYTTTCTTSLAAGANCALEFTYAPPYGDGCSVGTGGSCSYDSAPAPGPYQQGAYEQTTWNVGVPSGILTGIGNPTTFDRSGAVTLPGTLAGKAILATGTLSVTPTTTVGAPYNFGSQSVGVTSGTLTIIVTNSSASPVAYTVTPPSSTEFQITSSSGAGNTCVSPLAGKSSCNIYVTFEGTIPATYTDSIVVTPSSAAPITVYMAGVVQSNSGITLTTNNHAFGNLNTGTTATFGLGVTNNSLVAQPISLVYSAATGYTVTNGCPASLPAGGNCSISVKFAPTATGSVTQQVSISSGTFIVPGGTTSAPYTDALTFTGAGVTGGQFTATSVAHNFGAVAVGNSAGNYGVQLANNTTSVISLSLGSGFVNGVNGFSVQGTSCGATLAANASCELIFSFDPTASGFVTAAYAINSHGVTLYSGGTAVNPEQVSLSGTGN